MQRNSIKVSLNDVGPDGAGFPSLVVNGVELAEWIKPDWRLEEFENEDGFRQAELTVTFVAVLP